MIQYRHKEHGCIVEVLSKTLTHYYIKFINSGNRSNVSINYFDKNYKPEIKY